MKWLFSKFLVVFLLTSAVVLSWSEYFFLIFLSQKEKMIIEQAFQSLSLDPRDLKHKNFDPLVIQAKIEQFFPSILNHDLGLVGKFSKPNFEQSYAWSQL